LNFTDYYRIIIQSFPKVNQLFFSFILNNPLCNFEFDFANTLFLAISSSYQLMFLLCLLKITLMW